jgi:CxxC motif-containing protein (DUF1111 family)
MKRFMVSVPTALMLVGTGLLLLQVEISSATATKAVDPGVRGGPAGAGGAIDGLTPHETEYFTAGQLDFNEAETVEEGMGPRMNLDSCLGCHAQPASGGSSPFVNPQVAFATQDGGRDKVPPFLSANGPVREVRFIRNPDGTPDGGVHAIFTNTGRFGAASCGLTQPDWAAQANNMSFRIPTPVFGAGLIEQIPDAAILANRAANASAKAGLGIVGRPNFQLAGRTISGQTNRNGNDGTLARFGWKAQNKSLLLFAGEAYNVEMGITNELFQTERDEDANCQDSMVPNSITNVEGTSTTDVISSIDKFAHFMRFLAPPTPAPDTPSIARGRTLFANAGCALCHTPSFTTGNSRTAALRNKPVNLYSDLLIHDMGIGLQDGVSQGSAGPREFRTAPLWGLGQRVFFLHDGRTNDLITAIKAHASLRSEANLVVANFLMMSEAQKQDLLNFLRAL